MTDRELLELAAKAAGIDYHLDYYCDGREKLVAHGGVWNPLTYDGDALRLAVKLTINVFVMGAACQVEYWDNKAMKHAINIGVNDGDCNGDIFVATRRAIVRAAAEIGKGSMNDELRIQALQAALDQANMMVIEQNEAMRMALKALEACCGWPKVIDALREVLGETK